MASSQKGLRHVAWLRFKPGVTAERIEEHMAACRSLVGKVPALVNLECGRSLSDRSGGYTHGIICTLAKFEDLPAYLDHPEHMKIVVPLKEDIADLKVMDLEV